MAKPFRVTLSKRQLLERSQRISNYYADSFGKPRMQNESLAALPPKRVIRRPVDGKPVGPSEHQEQASVISWWALQHQQYNLPVYSLFAVPNGGARDAITGSRLKAEGVRRGTPDLVLAKPIGVHHGLYIEMKAQDGRESPEQQEFGKYLESVGYKFAFCYGAAPAIELIETYLAEPQ
jgi:hypothetical protein